MRTATHYKKFMTDEERDLLLQWVNNDLKRAPAIQMIFYLLIFLGLRVSEACSLKRENLNGDKITFNLAKSKRIHTRVIPESIKNILLVYISKYQGRMIDDYLFPPNIHYKSCSRYPYMRTDTISCYIQKFRKKHHLIDTYYTCKDGKKLYRISVHTIRHAFLTKFYELCGKDILLTAEVISHVRLNTTFEYLRAWEKFKREKEVVNRMARETDGIAKTSLESVGPAEGIYL